MAVIRWIPMGHEYWRTVCEQRICFWLSDPQERRCADCGCALVYVGLVEEADLD